jgi:hypothetical protein
MSKRKPIDPKELKVGDHVEWVEGDDFVWTVEVLDIRSHGIIVDSGYGKKALFAPNSDDQTKYTLLVGEMEMDDYIRYPKQKKDKKAKQNTVKPEKFYVGESIEWVERDGSIWDEKVLEVNGDTVTVSCSWAKKMFVARERDGKHMLLLGNFETDDHIYIRHPKKNAKINKK